MPASPLFACKHLVIGGWPGMSPVSPWTTVPPMSHERSDAQSGGQASLQRAQARLRVAVIDRDPGFLQVLANRLGALGCEHRALSSPATVETLVAMRLNALVVDLTVVGPDSWEYLERVCGRLPGLAVVVCTGPSSVAQRVRGLRLGADAWMTKPCHPEELICVIEAAVRRHRRQDLPQIDVAATIGEITIRPDLYQAYVAGAEPRADRARIRDPPAALPIRSSAAPRGDLRARVGLRDGARRPLGRRVRPQAPPEATCDIAILELHPHALRGWLQVCSRARRGRDRSEPRCARTGTRVPAALTR